MEATFSSIVIPDPKKNQFVTHVPVTHAKQFSSHTLLDHVGQQSRRESRA